MSVFLDKINSSAADVEKKQEDESDLLIADYKRYLPTCKPIAIYKNTKFLTIDKINGGLLTDQEKKEYKEANPPTGYKFDLATTKYFVIDVDVDESFKAKYCVDWKSELELIEDSIPESLPEAVEIIENCPNGKKRKLLTRNMANIIFAYLFKTPYVLTPSGGFHFYFENNLDKNEIKELFGTVRNKYVKVITLFDAIDIDIFLDSGVSSKDSYLVLPYSKILVDNPDKFDVETKVVPATYSGLRYCKIEGKVYDSFRGAKDLIKWLSNRVVKQKEGEPRPIEERSKYEERGRAIAVNEVDKSKYIKQFKEDMKVLCSGCDQITTWASRPFNLYHLMSFVTFFPLDLHFYLLKDLIEILLPKMSENAKDQLLSYYYRLATDKEKQKDQKGPKYMEAILNNTYNVNIDNHWNFIFENDDRHQNEEEEIIEEDYDDDSENLNSPSKIASTLAKTYNLKPPSF